MTDHAGSSAQRIRIGLTGLAIAFLLVLVSSIVSRSVNNDVGQPPTNTAAEPEEPLAQLGVAPGGSESGANNSVDKPSR